MVRAIQAGEVAPATQRHAFQVLHGRHAGEWRSRFSTVHSTIARESMHLAVVAHNTGVANQRAQRATGRRVRPFRLR